MTRTEHKKWCIDRALQEWDFGSPSNALASFASDVRKHPETAWIGTSPLFMAIMMGPVVSNDRAEFKKMMEGWAW